MKSEICIVGGGPAGLAAALALAQSGREVTVLDCAVPPIDKACGEGLLPGSLTALSRLGVTLSSVGTALHGIRFIDSESRVSADFPNATGRGLRRVLLHELLITHAEQAGVRLLWGIKNLQTRRGRVSFNGGHLDTNLIVGADGMQSSVRREAGLDQFIGETRRYGFRKHFAVAPWSQYVEVYWGNHFQIYVTPVAANQAGVALISSNPRLRLDAALRQLPVLGNRLNSVPEATTERGAVSFSRTLRRVCTDGYVLLGDASGSVDAITGEGMGLAFKQSAALVEALDAGNLHLYERSHRKISARPRQMAALLLMLDRSQILQQKALSTLARWPKIFSSLLAAQLEQKRTALFLASRA